MAWHNLRCQAFQIAAGICSVKNSTVCVPVVDLLCDILPGSDKYAVEKLRFIAVFRGTYHWPLFQPD